MSSRGFVIGCVVALAGFGAAQAAHAILVDERLQTREDEPFAPAPETAPFVSLGYREVAADLLFVRLVGYFGGNEATARGIAALAEAIAELDPGMYRIYELGARAMAVAKYGVDQDIQHRAIALLDRGRAQFPRDWRLPYVEGQIYAQDLMTPSEIAHEKAPKANIATPEADAKQRRAWDETGTLLVESAIRKPGAPQELATWASAMRTKLGQYDRAVAGLREMLMLSNDDVARANILAKLAELENTSQDALGSEILAARADFEAQWLADRPALPATMYLLLGPRPSPRIDLGDLATGGHGVGGATASGEPEHLAPPTDP